jgi:hypothetical protein
MDGMNRSTAARDMNEPPGWPRQQGQNEKVMVKRRQKSLRPATRINIPNAQDRGSPFEPSNCWQFAVSLAIPRENPATFSAPIHRNTQSDLADYRRTAPAYRNNLRHSCPTKLSR